MVFVCPTKSELASPKARLARRSLTGRTKCDWPASADWLFSLSRVLSKLLENGSSTLIQISIVNGMFFSVIACCVLILALMNGKLYLVNQVGGTHEKGMVDTYVVCWHVFDFIRIDF